MANDPLDGLRGLWDGGKPILWLGAGASCQADPPLPTLWGLVEALKREQSRNWDPPALDDPYALIDHFVSELGEGELHHFFERMFRPQGRTPQPGSLHRHLATLVAAGRFALIIDTNYDMLLRSACDDIAAAYRFSQLDAGLRLPDDGLTRYLSLHGTWDDWTSAIMTGRSYDEYAQRHPLAIHELELSLRRHRVLFVGCSLQDPRLLDWMDTLPDAERRRLHLWRALLGPGEGKKLEGLNWKGRTQAQVLTSIKQTELPDFASLPRWFEQLANEVDVSGDTVQLDVLVHAGPRWTITAAGARIDVAPPDITIDELARLRAQVGSGFPCESDGTLDPMSAARLQQARAAARSVGDRLTALLPEVARRRLVKRVGEAAMSGPATWCLRVEGEPSAIDEVMLLPWELLTVEGQFPVELGQLNLVREVVVTGAAGLPADVSELRILAHVAAPEDAPELDLEAASYRIARALDPLRDVVRFTELGTLEDLQEAARGLGSVTILHFSGHGSPGGLLFENDEGGGRKVSVDQLCDALLTVGTRLPAAVWLSCCYGAGPGTQAGAGTREWGAGAAAREASIAATLHGRGIPQVLGYFGPVGDALAARIDRDLFTELLKTGRTVEAVKRARMSSKRALEVGGGWAVYPLAWSMLALYHRGPDQRLFDPTAFASDSSSVREVLEPQKISIEGADGLPALERGFIGRRRMLAELRKQAKRGSRALGLMGMGGLGKTATMMRFAIVLVGANQTARDVIAIPVGARRSEQPFGQLQTLIRDVVAKHPRCPAGWAGRMVAIDEMHDPGAQADELARAVLLAARGNVLYLDNLETLQEYVDGDEPAAWREPPLERFFATLTREVANNTTVLMTSRCRPLGSCGEWVSLPAASQGEIFRMTAWWDPMRRLPFVLREELSAKIDGHPLTVQWINGLLSEGETEGLAPDADPVPLRRKLAVVLEGVGDKYEPTLVLEALIARLSDDERALLGECVEALKPVSRDVLDRLGKGAKRVINLGLVTRFGADEWGLHGLVRKQVHAAGLSPTTKGRRVLGEYWEAHARDVDGLKETLRHYVAAEHFEDAGRVMGMTNQVLRHAGLVRARFEFLEGLASIAWPDVQRHRWLHVSGDAAVDAGAYVIAESRARQSVELATQLHGTREHANVALSLHGLANVLVSLGKFEEAESAYRESIDVQVKAYGTREHTSVAASCVGLGNVLVSLGKFEEAESTYRESIDVQVKAYGTREHESVAASLHGLANVLLRLGKYEEAESTYRDCIEVTLKAYGTREHMSVAASLHGLANVLLRLGKYEEAESTYRDCIEVTLKAYGTREHAEVASSLHGLANVLVSLGKYQEAERTYRECIEVAVKGYGTREHASVAASLHGLANVLVSLEKYDEAERAWMEVVQIEERVFGSRHTVATIPTLKELAQLLLEVGRPTDAIVWSREAWTAAIQGMFIVEIAQVGPVHITCLVANQQFDAVNEVLPTLLGVLQGLPAQHPIRVGAEVELQQLFGSPR